MRAYEIKIETLAMLECEYCHGGYKGILACAQCCSTLEDALGRGMGLVILSMHRRCRGPNAFEAFLFVPVDHAWLISVTSLVLLCRWRHKHTLLLPLVVGKQLKVHHLSSAADMESIVSLPQNEFTSGYSKCLERKREDARLKSSLYSSTLSKK